MSAFTATLAAVLLVATPSPDAVQSGYATVNGVKIYYEVRGSGPPLVLLHGGLNTIDSTFSAVLQDLARKYRVVAIEQVGHGHSPDADRPYSYAQMAEDTAAVLAHLQVGRADVMGWSDGGIVALLLAVRHPERVRRLVVSGANTRLDGMDPQNVKWVQATLAAEMAKALPPAIREAYERTSPDGPAHWPVVVGKVRGLWLSPVNIDKAQLGAVSAPALVISGDRDDVLLEHSLELFRTLRNAQLFILPATGHRTFGTRAEWLLPMISSFLDAPDKPAK